MTHRSQCRFAARTALRALVVPVLALALFSCERDSAEIEVTIPYNGQTGVNSRSIIAIRLSNTMSSLDDTNTDARNITVTGDQTDGVYSGQIQAANHHDIFVGQTVDQFSSGVVDPVDPNNPPTAEELLRRAEEAEEKAEAGDDTLVFLLDAGIQFKPGEKITGGVSDEITVRGVPFMGTESFSFTIAGGAARAEGEFFVTATQPAAEAANVGVAPAINATFSQAVDASSVEGHVFVRGSQSGFHADGIENAPSTTESTHFLGADDHFLPGETVTVAWSSEIMATAGLGDSGAASLAPFVLRFQVKPGRNAGGWTTRGLPGGGADAIAVLTANFVAGLDGNEVAVVTARGITLHRQTEADVWEFMTTAFEGGYTVVAAVVVDGNDDGEPEIVALLVRGDEARLQEFALDDGGRNLVARASAYDFSAPNARGFTAGDINSDGKTELIVLHDETTFVPTGPGGIEIPGAPALSAGNLTFFELTIGIPADFDPLDLGNLDNLQELQYIPTRRPIISFDPATRIETHDLDGDGRLDLVTHTGDGLVLYRNQSTSSSPFTFRRVGQLAGPNPAQWVALDIDADHDVDILAWDGGAPVLWENFHGVAGGSNADGTPRGLLFDNLAPAPFASIAAAAGAGDEVRALNIDGDDAGLVDIAIGHGSGAIDVLLRQPDGSYVARALAGAGSLSAATLGDVNGDSGVDIAAVIGGVLFLYATSADDVIAPTIPTPSTFTLVDVTTEADLELGEVVVEVQADITRRFSGYSVALDYDEAVLDYVGFAAPESLANRASFTPCRDDGGGCSGYAAVSMSYDQNGVGAPFPTWVLGAFRFAARTVAETAVTKVEFMSFESGGKSYSNAITVSENGVEQSLEVTQLGAPFEVTVNPPPPPPLVVTCQVEERQALATLVRVAWSAELERYDRVTVSWGEGDAGVMNEFPWDQGAATLLVDFPGLVTISVTAVREGDDPLTESRTCSITNVLEPEITSCEFDGEANVITWTHAQADIDRFRVYRNGVLRSTLTGFTYTDRIPSADGGDLYEVSAVLANVESTRAVCRGHDPSPCETADPTGDAVELAQRTRASAANRLVFTWVNGEAYSGLTAWLDFAPLDGSPSVPLFGVGGQEIDPSSQQFEYEGDADRGGAEPGRYQFRLQAATTRPVDGSCPGDGPLLSTELVFDSINVPVPELSDVQMGCSIDGVNDILVTWLTPWQGYDPYLSLQVTHTVEGVATEIGGDGVVDLGAPPEEQEGENDAFDTILLSDNFFFVRDVEPIGSYEVRLVATFGVQSLVVDCASIDFTPTLSAGDENDRVAALIGAPGFEIPIRASSVFQPVAGYSFALEYPDAVTIEGFAEEAAGEGRKRIVVESAPDTWVDPDPDGDRRTDGRVVLTTLRASVPADFDLALRDPEPIVIDAPRMTFAGTGGERDVESRDGTVDFVGRFVELDRAEIDAGNEDPIRIAARITFTAPPELPSYRFTGFSLHVKFDPEVLELLPLTEDLQEGIVVDPERYFLPGDEVDEINRTGRLQVGWIGLLGTPFEYLEPVTDGELLIMHFRSRLGANSPEVFSEIRYITERSQLTEELTEDEELRLTFTSFLPEQDVPGVNDVDAHIAGGVLIRSDRALQVGGMSPNRGPLTGGNRVTIFGRELDGGTGTTPTVTLVAEDGREIEVPADDVDVLSGEEIGVVMPDSLLAAADGATRRELPPVTSTVWSVRVSLPDGTSSELAEAYSFDSPRLTSVDVRSVRAGCPDRLRVGGLGLSSSTSAAFRIGGDVYPAGIFRAVSADGTSMVIEAPSTLPQPPLGEESISAVLEISVADIVAGLEPLAVLPFSDAIRVLPSECDRPDLIVTGIEPGEAVHCSGDTVVVRGSGFTALTTVTFALNEGDTVANVIARTETSLDVELPATATIGVVGVSVRDGASEASSTFLFLAPPAFVRGDVDGSGAISITDATLLLQLLFGESSAFPANRDALDANDDGRLNTGDAMRILRFLFQGQEGGGDPLPAPSDRAPPRTTAGDICM